MRRRPGEVVVQSIALVLTVLAPTAGVSWLQEMFPGMPDPVANFIAGFLIALGLLSLWALTTARATLGVSWREDRNQGVELTQVISNLDRSTGQSQAFWVRVTHLYSEGLGGLALWLGARHGMEVRVEVLHSSMIFKPESDQRDGEPVIAFAREGCSLHVALRPKKPAPGATWGSVMTYFYAAQQRPTEEYTIDYTVTGSTRVAKWCGKLITIDPTARRLDENWR